MGDRKEQLEESSWGGYVGADLIKEVVDETKCFVFAVKTKTGKTIRTIDGGWGYHLPISGKVGRTHAEIVTEEEIYKRALSDKFRPDNPRGFYIQHMKFYWVKRASRELADVGKRPSGHGSRALPGGSRARIDPNGDEPMWIFEEPARRCERIDPPDLTEFQDFLNSSVSTAEYALILNASGFIVPRYSLAFPVCVRLLRRHLAAHTREMRSQTEMPPADPPPDPGNSSIRVAMNKRAWRLALLDVVERAS